MSFKLSTYVPLAIVAVMVMAIVAYVFGTMTANVGASAPSGLQSSVATTSNPIVGTTVGTLFATTTNCASRVISTVEKPIMLTFSDYAGQTPTATFGHLQSASTTVVYDSGIYGYGLVKVYGFDANSTITVTETR